MQLGGLVSCLTRSGESMQVRYRSEAFTNHRPFGELRSYGTLALHNCSSPGYHLPSFCLHYVPGRAGLIVSSADICHDFSRVTFKGPGGCAFELVLETRGLVHESAWRVFFPGLEYLEALRKRRKTVYNVLRNLLFSGYKPFS